MPQGHDVSLNSDQLFELRRQAKLELARRYAKAKDILNWGKVLFPEKFKKPFCQTLHGYFVDIRKLPLTNTEAPRGHAKTTIKCFLIPIFQALEEPEEFDHYLFIQSTEDKALAINMAIKHELETNSLIHALYGDVRSRERWTAGQFVLTNGVVFTAAGTGQSIRGINYLNKRPKYIIIDDLYDEDDLNNFESTEKKNAWFNGALTFAQDLTSECCLHVQGTAFNSEDILEKLKSDPNCKSRTFRGILDAEKKILLWPEAIRWEKLESIRIRVGSVVFEREIQNLRRDDKTSIVKVAWLRNWEYDPIELRQKIGKILSITAVEIGNDPSIGKNEENDFTGTALILKAQYYDSAGHEYYIDGLWNEKISLNARIEQLKSIAAGRPAELPVTTIRIEAIAGFNDYADEVIRRTNLPIKRIDWVKDKISTLENKSHYFENGKVFLNRNISKELKDMLLYQLTTNEPKHDDIRDAVLLCLESQGSVWDHL